MLEDPTANQLQSSTGWRLSPCRYDILIQPEREERDQLLPSANMKMAIYHPYWALSLGAVMHGAKCLEGADE